MVPHFTRSLRSTTCTGRIKSIINIEIGRIYGPRRGISKCWDTLEQFELRWFTANVVHRSRLRFSFPAPRLISRVLFRQGIPCTMLQSGYSLKGSGPQRKLETKTTRECPRCRVASHKYCASYGYAVLNLRYAGSIDAKIKTQLIVFPWLRN